MITRPRGVIFYPVLLALYPVLYLISVNQAQERLMSMGRSLLLAGLLGVGLYGLLWAVLRSAGRAALLASIWLLLFFGYGHIYNLVEGWRVAGVLLGRHTVLLAVWAFFGLLASIGLLRSRSAFTNLSRILNFVSLGLVLLLIGQIGFVQGRQALAEQQQRMQRQAQRAERLAVQQRTEKSLPDVYYIILDGHTRSDMLRVHYQFDNAPLLQPLRQQGFYIADCARSNYTYTALSLSATLNMQYLQTLAPDLATAEGDSWSGEDGHYLRHSLVRQKFEEMGYAYIAFESGYPAYEAQDADFFFAPPTDWRERWQTLNAFEGLVLDTTLLRAPIERNGGLTDWSGEMISPDEIQYRRIHYTLDQLARLPADLPGPKFVFAHITAPHHPYVLAADGSFRVWPEEQKHEGYLAAVTYLDGRIAQVVEEIRTQSDPAPIIIIQGDHGIDGQTRLEVLNALSLPCAGQPMLYPTLSSVNTFRVVFDACFGEQNGLLEDISYSSVWGQRTQFEVSPPECFVEP